MSMFKLKVETCNDATTYYNLAITQPLTSNASSNVDVRLSDSQLTISESNFGGPTAQLDKFNSEQHTL